MPSAPGVATILIVEIVEDTSQLDRKGQPATHPVVTPVAGCKVAPFNPSESRTGAKDYASLRWHIATPPHPAAIALKADGLVWYDDGGRYAGQTVRTTYTDPQLGERDVAVFQVTGALVLTDQGDAVDHVTITAKSELG